jgi:hypothetical protein
VRLPLASSVVEIKDGQRSYFGPLLLRGARDGETGRFFIELNPDVVALYGSDGWTQVEWEQRQALKGKPLAQWLHGFYSSHAKPYPIKVETLHRLCGSDNQKLFSFKQELKTALELVAVQTGWAWNIDDKALVHIDKKPTASGSKTIKNRLASMSVLE